MIKTIAAALDISEVDIRDWEPLCNKDVVVIRLYNNRRIQLSGYDLVNKSGERKKMGYNP